MELKPDVRKEAYLLAALGLLLAVYKVWRYWGDENLSPWVRAAYGFGLAMGIFVFSVDVIEFET